MESPEISSRRALLVLWMAAALFVLALTFSLLSLAILGLFWVGAVGWARARARRGLDRIEVERRGRGHAHEDEEVELAFAIRNRGAAPVARIILFDRFGPALVADRAVPDPDPLPPWSERVVRWRAQCFRNWGSTPPVPWRSRRAIPSASSGSAGRPRRSGISESTPASIASRDSFLSWESWPMAPDAVALRRAAIESLLLADGIPCAFLGAEDDVEEALASPSFLAPGKGG